MALDTYPTVAWPLMHAQLAAAQEAFLAGDCYARPEATAAAALAAAGGTASVAQPALLRERFAVAVTSGDAAAAGGSTDAGVRLTHLLKALAAANNNVVEGRSRDWVPHFLAFAAAGAGGEDGESSAARGAAREAAAAAEDSEDEDEEGPEDGGAAGAPGERRGVVAAGIVSGRAWRSGLREWLAMLAGLKGARGMYQWEAVQASRDGVAPSERALAERRRTRRQHAPHCMHRAAGLAYGCAYLCPHRTFPAAPRPRDLQRTVAMQLMDVDPAVQQGALKCLKASPGVCCQAVLMLP